MMLIAFLAVAAGSFALGILTGVLGLSAQEADYEDALDALRRVRGA